MIRPLRCAVCNTDAASSLAATSIHVSAVSHLSAGSPVSYLLAAASIHLSVVSHTSAQASPPWQGMLSFVVTLSVNDCLATAANSNGTIKKIIIGGDGVVVEGVPKSTGKTRNECREPKPAFTKSKPTVLHPK